MIRVAIVDANERADLEHSGQAASVVAQWLAWETQRAGVPLADPGDADVILLCFAGALDWAAECARELRRVRVVPEASRRAAAPYIVAGGPVDATPLTALGVADALCVGEGYRLVRELLARVLAGESVRDIDAWLTQHEHAITRQQTEPLARDQERPWLFAAPPPRLATPDTHIDWDVPHVRSSDGVTRIIGSKGCHFKCSFCATTYRQPYQVTPHQHRVARAVRTLSARGGRVQILSNDPLNIPWFHTLEGRLDSESFTIAEMADDANRAAVIRTKPRIARFGVEGLSERIRRAFGKPIADDRVLEIIADLHGAGINTHMFYIVGAPYEAADDWAQFRALYARLARTVRRGLCRIKLTTFLPTPPAPLTRYVPGAQYAARMAELQQWIGANSASRHIVYIRGRGAASRARSVAEQLAIQLPVAQRLCESQDTIDLAPTPDDYARLQHALIEWPIDLSRQWKIADVYRRRMAAPTEVAA